MDIWVPVCRSFDYKPTLLVSGYFFKESGHQNDPKGDNNLNNQDVTSIKSISLFTSVVFGIMTVVKKTSTAINFYPFCSEISETPPLFSSRWLFEK